MSERPIREYGDRLNWDLLSRAEFRARQLTSNPDSFAPIPPYALPCNSPILTIGTRSSSAKSHWKLGCWAQQQLLYSPSSTSEFLATVYVERQFCRLDGLTLIEFPRHQLLPYLLVLDIPRWHRDLDVEIWTYSGIDADGSSRDDIEVEIDFEE